MKIKGLLTKTTAALALAAAVFTGVSLEAKAAASYFNAYDKAAYETTSKDFSLKVDGKSVDVVEYYDGTYSYAHLAYEGTATFEVTAKNGSISSYELSPHSYNMKATKSDNKLTFSLKQDGSRYIIVELKAGGQSDMLVIAADPKERYSKPNIDGNKNVDITKAPYNADKTGKNDVSDVIQKAIDDVSNKGGGTVYVPAGVYKFVYIDARDNVTLFLDEGAFLRGSDNRNDYEWGEPGENGIQGRRSIDIKASKNFKIVGRGVIDANSTALVEVGSNGKADGYDDYRKGIIDGNGAQNFTLDGVTVKDATGWTFSIQLSKNVECKNVKMLNHPNFVHSDGYDFLSCNGVEVIDCFGITGDDIFCPKASVEGAEMKNYLYKNCVGYGLNGAGCKVGMQARGNTSNIEFNDIDIIGCHRGISISHDDGNGDFSDIRFINIRSQRLDMGNKSGQFRTAPFVIWTLQKNNKGATVENIQVTDCTFEDYFDLNGIVQGSKNANSYVKNVTFTNVKMNGTVLTEANKDDYVSFGSNISNIKFQATGSASSSNDGVYEAEDGNVAGGAEVVDKDIASGDQIVGNIGGDGKTNGKVTFTVNADSAGTYDLKIFYLLKGDRSFYVTVNGGDSREVECSGDNWNAVKNTTIQVDLNKGSNTIRLDNGAVDEWAPNLDKIELTKVNNSYEAEKATIAGGATVVDKDVASGDQIVGNIGGDGKANGKVTFNVNVSTSGTYYLDIHYLLKGDRNFYCTVNGGDSVKVSCSGDNWNKVATKTIEVQLNSGSNTIKLDNGAVDEWAPNLDKIELRKK